VTAPGFDIYEWCSISDGYGNPIIYANAECCEITPTTTGSWGRVKTLYR
jgi:hypothetical protein